LPDYDPATYGDRMAEVYDEWFGTRGTRTTRSLS
jgi:hypothetical protein